MNRLPFLKLYLFVIIMGFGISLAQGDEATASQSQPAQTQNQTQTYPATLEGLKAQIEALKADYEKRIKALEDQVEQLQVQALQAPEEEPATAPPAQQQVQSIPGALNPSISVAANFVGRADNQHVVNEDGNPISDRLNLREAEIDLRVPIDPYADGVLITTLESETPGEYSPDVEEGYVTIKKLPFQDQPFLGMKFKVGRFRPAFGKMNVLHTHDQPQTFRPLSLQEFFGDDGFVGTGIDTSFFIPTPWESSTLDASIDILTTGHVALSPDPDTPLAYLGHVRWFRTFADEHNVELGFSSYYHPSGTDSRYANANGIDFLYRWKPIRMGEWKSYLLGAEYYFAPHSYPDAEESPEVNDAIAIQGLQPGEGKPKGFTVWNQWQFNRRIYAGLRYDQTETLFNPEFNRQSLTPYLSYYFSEFLRFRLNYEHRWSDFVTEDGRNSLYFELNWIFGSHPPEPFWVNK